MAAQQEQLRQFWLGHMQEIHQVGTDPAEFKNHQLPLARIKKVRCSSLLPTSSSITTVARKQNLSYWLQCLRALTALKIVNSTKAASE